MNQSDKNLIEYFYEVIIKYPNSCAEVRIFDAMVDHSNRIIKSKYPTTVSGWFTKSDELLAELSRVCSLSCYITVNPVSLRRRPLHAKNTLKVLRKGEFTVDEDIMFIRYVIIDIDPLSHDMSRKVNSTNQELFNCITVRDRIVDGLGIAGNCMPGTSGNGAFILLSLPDYENNIESINDVAGFVEYINTTYSDGSCKIDIQTRNPSRQLAIPGTMKYRDLTSSRERPHRKVEIKIPGYIDETSRSVRFEGIPERPS